MQSLIKLRDVRTVFGTKVVHDGLNITVNEGEIYGLVGPSGCGKTTVLREMVMLQEISGGKIEVLGHDLSTISSTDAQKLRSEWGVLFQAGALFSSLNIKENISLPLREYTDLSQKMIDEVVKFKINLVGLKSSDAHLYPSQISGGMKKKSALARALAMDPKLLFLDEPTSGLDPISAREFDALILKLRDLLDLSIVMVSHDLQSVYATLDRVAVIDEKKIIYEGDLKNIKNSTNKFMKTFFRSDFEQ
ncbi:sulfate ABC transporter ATP-binding protein [Sulfurimonas hongkongensis]|uniref:Sulfate ABC transporter ATP-binding protein n=1 Tax=Sulfurimonas hongkongensis TaxID=1172190 RepID=T0JFS3_9BACT|nr:ATP-binding cassette domain-containing protein [Sulfurimonas hongkongensis]EQB39915.1 sulfate ABC transporter ATP-binding protein [Sulfurimonas hongkongensis]